MSLSLVMSSILTNINWKLLVVNEAMPIYVQYGYRHDNYMLAKSYHYCMMAGHSLIWKLK